MANLISPSDSSRCVAACRVAVSARDCGAASRDLNPFLTVFFPSFICALLYARVCACTDPACPIQNVHHPPKPPSDEEFWLRDTFPRRPDVAFLRKHFHREGRLQEGHAVWILEEGRRLMKEEPNVLDVEAPVTSIISLHLHSAARRSDGALLS